jgi:hypothetical protein
MAKAKKPVRESSLDPFVPHLRAEPGPHSIAGLMVMVLDVPEPRTDSVLAAVKLMREDDRFSVNGDGLTATVELSEALRAGEPEDITAEASDVAQVTMCDAPAAEAGDPPPDIDAPPAADAAALFGEQPAADVPTIAEHLAAAEASEPVSTTHEKAPTEVLTQSEVEAQRSADARRAEEEKAARLKEIGQAIIAVENSIHHLSTDLKEKKDRLKVLRSEMVQLATGDTQARLTGEGEDDGEEFDAEDPASKPVFQAAAGKVPPIQPMVTEAPEMSWYRKMGATAADQGKTEIDCPFSRESNAKGLTGWLDGFREQKRADHSVREAQVQALFRPALVESALPAHGILPAGEEQPKVAAVDFDGRKHLVLDMLAEDEGDTPGVERWQIAPLFTKQEWAETFLETYGPAIKGVDKDDEAKAVRIKGGIDCGRLVKVGRSTLVVGPLERLMVVTTKPEQAAAAAAGV